MIVPPPRYKTHALAAHPRSQANQAWALPILLPILSFLLPISHSNSTQPVETGSSSSAEFAPAELAFNAAVFGDWIPFTVVLCHHHDLRCFASHPRYRGGVSQILSHHCVLVPGGSRTQEEGTICTLLSYVSNPFDHLII